MRSLRRGAREDCKKAKAATSDRVREACEGVREKAAKRAGAAKDDRVRECCIKANAAESDRVQGDCRSVCRRRLPCARKLQNSLLAVTDVDEEL